MRGCVIRADPAHILCVVGAHTQQLEGYGFEPAFCFVEAEPFKIVIRRGKGLKIDRVEKVLHDDHCRYFLWECFEQGFEDLQFEAFDINLYQTVPPLLMAIKRSESQGLASTSWMF